MSIVIMKDFGLVSIITPNYNCGRFIASTIESVLSQTYQNWELLIQDDCSTDESLSIAMEYAEKDSRIKIYSNGKNSGAAVTRNNAIARSKGEWLAFLDSDDLWTPDKLEKQLKWMVENDADFSFTEYEHISEEGEKLGIIANVTDKLSYKKLLHEQWPGCLTVMYRQDLNHKIYGSDISKNNDAALFLKVLKGKKPGRGIPECLALYRIRKGSISRNKFKMIEPYVRVVHEFEGKSLFYSYICVATHLFFKTFKKYRKIK